jgi:hypothetical protein
VPVGIGLQDSGARSGSHSLVQGDPNARIAETDDVASSLAGEVEDCKDMIVRVPAAIERAEAGYRELRRHRPSALEDRDPDSVVGEADDVGAPGAGPIGQLAGVRGGPGRLPLVASVSRAAHDRCPNGQEAGCYR